MKYTIFARKSGGALAHRNVKEGLSLQEGIDAYLDWIDENDEERELLAWAPERTADYGGGGKKSRFCLYNESVVAGRTIRKVGTAYVVEGDVPPEETPKSGLKFVRETTYGTTPPAAPTPVMHPKDAAMIKRDGPAKPREPHPAAPVKTPTKPAPAAPAGLMRSPDLGATSHLVAPVHGSAFLGRL